MATKVQAIVAIVGAGSAGISIAARLVRKAPLLETNLLKFMQGTKQFIIPIYLRKYSWTIHRCRRLRNDIVKAAEDEKIKGHFVGFSIRIQKIRSNSYDERTSVVRQLFSK